MNELILRKRWAEFLSAEMWSPLFTAHSLPSLTYGIKFPLFMKDLLRMMKMAGSNRMHIYGDRAFLIIQI